MSLFSPIELTAFGLGILHAFEPGHGKTLIAGALVNTKRVWRDPVILALSSAIGHMVGVLLFTTLSYMVVHNMLSVSTAQQFPVLIGVTLIAVGTVLLVREGSHARAHAAHGECSCCSAQVTFGINKTKGVKGVSIVGLLAGLVPCPSVLALASSTSVLPTLQRALSVALIFGVGVAIAMLALGLSVTHLSQRLNLADRFSRSTNLVRHVAPIALIVVGAAVIMHGSLGHSDH